MIKKVITKDFEMEVGIIGKGKKPLVMIPGLSLRSPLLSIEAIEGAYSQLSDDFTIYIMDYRKELKSNFTAVNLAEDDYEVIKELGLKDIYLLGASFGGILCQIIAENHSENVKKACIASSSSQNNEVSRKVFNTWIDLAKSYEIEKLNEAFFNICYTKTMLSSLKEVLPVLLKQGTKEECDRFVITETACRDFNEFSGLEKIKCPFFALGAGNDRVFTKEETILMAKKLNCDYYIYDGFEHAVYDEAPDFIKRIKLFLEKD